VLLGDPATIMLDEPTNSLDPDGILWIRTLLQALAGESRTVVVSSHLMSEMALTAEHLIVIGKGGLLAGHPASRYAPLTPIGCARCSPVIESPLTTDEPGRFGGPAPSRVLILKDAPPADLVSAIRSIAAGDAVVAPSVTRRLIDTYAERLPLGEPEVPHGKGGSSPG
jgi:energy-coupling factor transporter ATP-binding protein EcfA2